MGGLGSGGRRRGAQRAQLPACAPPSPPRGLSAAERAAWRELAGQVTAAKTYTPARLSAFKLAVKALALVYAAPADLKPGTLHSLIKTASAMLARFGLDSLSANAADAAPPENDEQRILEKYGVRPGPAVSTARQRADYVRRLGVDNE